MSDERVYLLGALRIMTAEALTQRELLLSSSKCPSWASHGAELGQVRSGKNEEAFFMRENEHGLLLRPGTGCAHVSRCWYSIQCKPNPNSALGTDSGENLTGSLSSEEPLSWSIGC